MASFEFELDGIMYFIDGEYIEEESGDWFYPGAPDDFNIVSLETDKDVDDDGEPPRDDHELKNYILETYYQ